MTSFAMIFGMRPIAPAAGSASEVKNGFALVLVGGLTSSLLLKLVLAPVVYLKMVQIRGRLMGSRARRGVEAVPAA